MGGNGSFEQWRRKIARRGVAGRMVKAPAQANVPQLIALDAVFCGGAVFGSEDANEGCFCGDAGGFVIKKNGAAATMPHDEWFCSSLAAASGVPQVPFSVIRHTDGNLWFGSRWMNGKTADWWNLAQQGSIDFATLADDLSRIYALDLFIHNVDRHANNFMVVPEGSGHRVYSFDYSRAWLHHGFPPPQIMTEVTLATLNVREWLKRTFGVYINVNVAMQILDNIDRMNTAAIERIISSHPKDWLTQQQEDDIVNWWGNGSASARVAAIKTGLNDGTLV